MSSAVLVGAGPIGVAALRGALEEGVINHVRAVVDPADQARAEAAEIFGCEGVTSTHELADADEGDWAIVAFSSSAEAVAPEIVRLCGLGYHVATTCEELSRPPGHIREAIRSSAISGGRKVIATGANPGFVMDRLALAVATGVRSVQRVTVERRVDTSTRRGPLVAKTGRGMTAEEFDAGVKAGRIGHVGLDASAKLLARGLLWPTHDVAETIEPVLDLDGNVAGLHQRAVLNTPDGAGVVLDLTMAWQVDHPGDFITVEGSPRLRVEIPDGYHGDEGTTAMVVNAIGRYTDLEPGYYRPIDLPLRFS